MVYHGGGRQYRSITPERVREIVSKDTVYLIPYPYVGYYYLADQAMAAHDNAFSSSMPFYAEYHPQDGHGVYGHPRFHITPFIAS